MVAQLVRRSARPVLFVAVLAALLLLLAMPAAAINWIDFQAAAGVLGQPGFGTNGTGLPNAINFTSPRGIAVDPTTGKVFVVDNGHERVLRFSALAAVINGSAAEAVLGQPDFTHDAAATTPNGMCSPQGVFVDSAGRLWVSDFCNRRVLRFDNAASKLSGANADGVLGQPDFISNVVTATQSGMAGPIGVVGAFGTLFVADSPNNRVLIFYNAASQADGANADLVLGQPDFTSHVAHTTQNGMSFPHSVFIDGDFRLWVADRNNHRVLRFDYAHWHIANGANADGVLGKFNFTSAGASGITATSVGSPDGVTVDAQGRLYVVDETDNRVLIFNHAATLGNGAPACNVLGQPDFTSNTINNGGLSAKSLWGPMGIFFDVGRDNLWVADAVNQRVLRFGTAVSSSPNLCNFIFLPLIIK